MKGRGEKGIFSGRLKKIKGELEVFSGEKGFPVKGRAGYFSGRLRKMGEREVFSGEELPSEGERGERDIFQGD